MPTGKYEEVMNEQELLRLKKDIDSAKTRVSELRGQKELLMQELLEKFDSKSIKAAEKKLLVMKDELQSLEDQITAAVKEIKFGGDNDQISGKPQRLG